MGGKNSNGMLAGLGPQAFQKAFKVARLAFSLKVGSQIDRGS